MLEKTRKRKHMERRKFMALCGTGLLVGVPGCATGTDNTESPTATPEPQASVLRIQVQNSDTTAQDVTFRLKTQSPGADVLEQFGLTDVAPDTTETVSRTELPAGNYELEILLPRGSWTFRWAGYECEQKQFEIRLSEEGNRVADRCLDE